MSNPRLESHDDLQAEPDGRIAALLDEALVEFRVRGSIDTTAYEIRCPDVAAELPDLFQTLRKLDAAADDWRVTPLFTNSESTFQAESHSTTGDDPLPEQIARYRILARIGSGGMGTVYKACDPQLQRLVALKVPRFEGSQRRRAVAMQRFLREARALAQVHHPHVCPIHDVGEENGLPYVVMEYVEGRSLAERLRQGRYEDPQSALALIRQAAEGLAAVHAHGFIHRDVKPGNILIDAAGRAVLTDFGLARSVAEAEPLTLEGSVVGTPAYMAPEQAAGEATRIGPWTDLYGLGVVLYQMLTGRLPFEGPMLPLLHKVGYETPPPPSRFRQPFDADLEAMILRALAKRPEDRYRSAAEFVLALDRLSAGLPLARRPAPRRFGRKAIGVAVAIAALLVVMVAQVVIIRLNNKDGSTTEIEIRGQNALVAGSEPPGARADLVAVLVARQDIPRLTWLRKPETSFEFKSYPKRMVPQDAVTTYDELRGKILIRGLAAGEYPARHLLQNEGRLQSSSLMAGMRAMALPTTPETADMLPGDRVAVLYSEVRKGELKPASSVVLRNIQVLAIDLAVLAKASEAACMVTLELTPDEALILAPYVQEDKVRRLTLAKLPGEKKRLVSLTTITTRAAGGFVLPGSRIDVIYTERPRDKQPESKRVLEQVLVKGIDLPAAKPGDPPGEVSATVTLEVTVQQGYVLEQHKAKGGTFTLLLTPLK